MNSRCVIASNYGHFLVKYEFNETLLPGICNPQIANKSIR